MNSMLLDIAGRRRSPATLPGYHCGRPPRNKGLRYPADPPSVEEIVAWHWPRAISTGPVGRSSCAAGRAVNAARSAWIAGPGSGCNPGSIGAQPCRSARCCARPRASRGSPVVGVRSSCTAASRRRPRGRAQTLRAAPAPSCPRRGDGARGRSDRRYPTPARPRQSRHHLGLPARHRQRRDHRHGPRPSRTDDSRECRPALRRFASASRRLRLRGACLRSARLLIAQGGNVGGRRDTAVRVDTLSSWLL